MAGNQTLTIDLSKPKASYNLKGVTKVVFDGYTGYNDLNYLIKSVAAEGNNLTVVYKLTDDVQEKEKSFKFMNCNDFTTIQTEFKGSDAGWLSAILMPEVAQITAPQKGTTVTGSFLNDTISLTAYYQKDRNGADIGQNDPGYAKAKTITINSGLGNDTITGSIYKDIIKGEGGNDSIIGSLGADSITGGAGYNTIKYEDKDHIDGDKITLTKGEHLLIKIDPSVADSATYAYKGNDLEVTVYKAAEPSVTSTFTIANFAKTDVTNTSTKANPLGDPGEVQLEIGVSTVNLRNEVMNLDVVKNYTGTWHNEKIDGSAYVNPGVWSEKLRGLTLDGGAGNDSIIGSQNADILKGGAGDDTLLGGSANDQLNGGDGNDELDGEAGNDTLVGGAGHNVIKLYTEHQFGDDVVTLTKGEQLDLMLDKTTGDYVSAKINGSDLVISVYSENGNKSANKLQGTVTIKNYAKQDVINAATDGWLKVIYSNGNPCIDLRNDLINVNVTGNYAGGWLNENIDGSAYVAQDKQGNPIPNNTKGLNLNGGAGNDSITGSTYNDTIIGGVGHDTLKGGKGNDSITGTDGNNKFFFTAGDGFDTITAGKGHDTIELFAVEGQVKFERDTKNKKDLIIRYNGSGNDKENYHDCITVKNYYKTVKPESEPAGNLSEIIINYQSYNIQDLVTLPGGIKDIEEVIAELNQYGNFEDTVSGKNYIVLGDERTNNIRTGSGNDLIDGGAGNDSITVLDGNNGITGGDGNDTITVNGSGNNTIDGGEGVNRITINATGQNSISAGSGNDVITITGGTNTITSGAGNDYASISGGINNLNLGDGSDTLYVDESAGASTITGGTGDDYITVESSADSTIYGGNQDGSDTGRNSISVSVAGNHEIHAGTSSSGYQGDSIYAGNENQGNFTIYGGGNNDYINASNAAKTSIDGGTGNDTIQGGHNGQNTIYGGRGNDSITAAGNQNTIYGGEGEDSINAAGNQNVIYGGYDTIGTDADSLSAGGVNAYNNRITAGEQSLVYAGVGVEATKNGPYNPITTQFDTITYTKGDSIEVGANSTVYGAAGDDTVVVSGSQNQIYAGAGNDYIQTDDSDATQTTVVGGAGSDTIHINNAGVATVDGGEGNDYIYVSGANNTIYGGLGADEIVMNEYIGVGQSNIIYGGSDSLGTDDGANNISSENKGNTTIYGGNGDSLTGKGDTIYAGKEEDSTYYGNNVIYGGSRNDAIYASNSASASITGGAGNDTIYGSHNGNNTIYGGEGNDSITAYGSSNYIEGGVGNDTITSYSDDAARENITIIGGTGNDSITVNSKNAETLIFRNGDGNDTINLYNYSSVPEGMDTICFEDSTLDELTASVSGSDLIITYHTGGQTTDSVTIQNFVIADSWGKMPISTIRYKNGDTISIMDFVNTRSVIDVTTDYFSGSNYSERINGRSVADSIYAGHGNDTVYGLGGNDTLYGQAGNDSLLGGDGDDSIDGGEEDDVIDGGAGNDSLYGSYGDDTLYGGAGQDSLSGYEGDDVLYADAATTIAGGEGNSSTLYGGDGDDTLYGGSGNDSLYGEDGNDVIHARYGNNYINGGAGNNELYSGAGNDTFYFSGSVYDVSYTDTIHSGSGSDTISIGYSGYSYESGANNFYEQNFVKDGNNLVITTGINEDTVSSVVVDGFFSNPGHSAKYFKYSNTGAMSLRDAYIYQKGESVGETGATISGTDYNDLILGSDKADTFNSIGTATTDHHDLVVGGAGNDTYNVADGANVKINISNGDGNDTITNAENANKVIIHFKNEASYVDSYQSGDDYIIERRYYANEEWHMEKTVLADFHYDPGTNNRIEIHNGNYADATHLSDYHIAEFDPSKVLARTLDNNFTTTDGDTVSYYVLGSNYADSITAGAGNDYILSGEGRDTIHAGSGDNYVYAAGGDAVYVDAGTGDDTITVGYGQAHVTVTGGDNRITTGDNNDTISITGDSGTNIVHTGGGYDNVSIAGGDNTVTSANTNSSYYDAITIHGTGTNTVTETANGLAIITVDGSVNTITTGTSQDTIVAGGTTSNNITTKGYKNTVTVSGANATVNITESTGSNDITLSSTGTNTVNVTGDSNSINATAGNNTITIKADTNTPDPMTNNVTISGGGANTLSIEGEGNYNVITVNNASGTATVTGSQGYDTINLVNGTNTVNANGGSDRINISGGANTVNLDTSAGAGVTITGASTNVINDNEYQNSYNIGAGTNTLNLSGNGQNTDNVTISGGTNTVNGSAYSEYISTVSGGTNVFDLKAGNDTIYVKDTSTNTIYGGLGYDSIEAGYGTNTIYGGNALNAGVSEDDDHNYIELGGVSAVVYAGSQGDTVEAGRDINAVTVHGGAGNDYINFSINTVGTINVEGGAGDDSISATKTGNSTISGGDGADTINVYHGDSNVITGGAGNDSIKFEAAGDGEKAATVTGGAGDDRISLDSDFKETLIFNANDGADIVIGSNGDTKQDVLVFNGMNLEDLTATYDSLNNYSLTISYTGGSVTLDYVNGIYNDLNTSVSRIVTDDGPDGGYTLEEFMNLRSIYTLTPQSTVEGAYFSGLKYNEMVTGTDLADTIYGDNNDTESGGNDTIYGGGGNDTIYGDMGNDSLYGDAGNDIIDGGAGNDTIYGGAGNDIIRDRAGINTIYGGAGNDTIDAALDDPSDDNKSTIVFAEGDGRDLIKNYSMYSTLKFANIDAYDDLHISYEYDDSSSKYNLVIQYGDTQADKVVLYDYKYIDGRNTKVLIEGHGALALNTLLDNKNVMIPETPNENAATITGSVNDDYIFATDWQSTITAGLGNDTIESVGDTYDDGQISSIGDIKYKFDKDGDGHDVIVNAQHKMSGQSASAIIFTDFDPADLDDQEFRAEFFENLVCTKSGNDLTISYGANSSITIKDYYGNEHIRDTFFDIVGEDTEGTQRRIDYFSNIQVRRNVQAGVEFIGDNDAAEYITGTAGNDTILAGAVNTSNGSVFVPGTGQDTIIFDNRYEDEEHKEGIITGGLHALNVNMQEGGTPDTLWFKNIESMDNLAMTHTGDALEIRYYNVQEEITEYFVSLRGFLSSGDPGFTKIKIGTGETEDAKIVTTIQALAEYLDYAYGFNNTEEFNHKHTINTSILDDSVYLVNEGFAEVVNTREGNDTIGTDNETTNTDTGADTVHAGAGNDAINYGNDYGNDGLELYGDEGNDQITSSSGGKIFGGAGSDHIDVYDSDAYHTDTGNYRNVTVYGGTIDHTGESAADEDTIYAYSSHGNNEIHGGLGKNTIYGGYGNDTIYGGEGDDSINAGEGSNHIEGNGGADWIRGYSDADYIDGGDGDDTLLGYTGDDTIYGGAGDDTIYSEWDEFNPYGNDTHRNGNTVLRGGEGEDAIWAKGRQNEIWGDEGDDTIKTVKDGSSVYHFNSGDGDDTIYSSNRISTWKADTIVFDDIAFEDDNVVAEMNWETNQAVIKYDYNAGTWASSITIDNFTYYNPGSPLDYHNIQREGNYYEGRKSSIQYLIDKNGKKLDLKKLITTPEQTGVATDSQYTVFSDNITFSASGYRRGGAGNDTLIGFTGNDTIYGDYLYETDVSGSGDDYIDGGLGKNILYGGAGNDTLVGGNDNNIDTLVGGTGANTYLLKSGAVNNNEQLVEIRSISANDVIQFADVTHAANISFSKVGNDLKISYFVSPNFNEAVIKDYFSAPHDYVVKYGTNGNNVTSLHTLFGDNFSGASYITGSTETDATKLLKVGSTLADTINAHGNSANTIFGGDGNDKIVGSDSGSDVIHGGAGNDSITFASGLVFGGAGDDKIAISNTATVYGGQGADSILGYYSSDYLIFTGEKPNDDDISIAYSSRVFNEGYVDIYETFDTASDNAVVTGGAGNDTICAFGENIKSIDGDEGNDKYHTMLTNNIYITDGNGTDTLQLHSIGSSEKAYIVMNVTSGNVLNSLYVVNEENYNDWLENNGSFSSGHGGVKLAATDSVDTITSSENKYVATSDLNTLKSEIASWLDGKCGDVAQALANDTYRDELIAMFNTFNENEWVANS